MFNEYTDKLVARAERDADFRSKLQSDPSAAISEELGVEVPESVKVTVMEEEPNQVILVLPTATARPGALREEELAMAAGGAPAASGDWIDTHIACAGHCGG